MYLNEKLAFSVAILWQGCNDKYFSTLCIFVFAVAAQGGTSSFRLNQPEPAGEIPTRRSAWNHEPGVTQFESLYLKGQACAGPGPGSGCSLPMH